MAQGKRQSDGLSSGPVGKRQRTNASAPPKPSLIVTLSIPSVAAYSPQDQYDVDVDDESSFEKDYDDDGMTVEQIIAPREEEEAIDFEEVVSEDEETAADDLSSRINRDDGLAEMVVVEYETIPWTRKFGAASIHLVLLGSV